MRPLSKITDPTFTQPLKYNAFERFWLKLIRDKRDLPFVFLTLKITFIMLPVALLLYFPLPGWLWWTTAALYFFLNNFTFKGPFGLMLHCTSHRKFFKSKYGFLNNYLPWVIGPFFGQTPETYASHHLGMHHVENNLEDDISSTMLYQRDSLRSFLSYFFNFLFLGLATTAKYFNMRRRNRLRNRVLTGEFVFFAVCAALCFISWQATVWVFLVPFFLSRVIMMVGNWAQHSFVDYDDPGNCYKNSITCINTSYNHKCWNDGYHINHHLKPAMHYTLYPKHFEQNLDEFKENKALVFEGIHFLHVWYFLMRKKYKKLASHLVNIDGMFESEEEAIKLMKSRTARMPKRGITVRTLKLQATQMTAASA